MRNVWRLNNHATAQRANAQRSCHVRLPRSSIVLLIPFDGASGRASKGTRCRATVCSLLVIHRRVQLVADTVRCEARTEASGSPTWWACAVGLIRLNSHPPHLPKLTASGAASPARAPDEARNGQGCCEQHPRTSQGSLQPRDAPGGGGPPGERKKLALAPRSKPKEEAASGDAQAGAGKANPFGSAKARAARPDDYLSEEKREEQQQSASKPEEARQPSKPKANPFGAAKPVTVKYGELDQPPPASAPAAAAPEAGLEKQAEALTIS